MPNKNYRAYHANDSVTGATPSDNGHYDAEWTSALIIVMVSAFGKFWSVLAIAGSICLLLGVALLAMRLFVRGMAGEAAKIADPWRSSEATSSSVESDH